MRTDQPDRRREARSPVRSLAVVYPQGREAEVHTGTTINVSLSGLLIEVPTKNLMPEPGSEVVLWVSLLGEIQGGENVGMTGMARILRVEHFSPGTTRFALTDIRWDTARF
jgi:hypothetical protein